MNRNHAERAVAESDLPMAETLTMMMLLRRADNSTLQVPEQFTPTMRQLAAEVRVSVRWLQKLLKHLEKHGWVKVAPGRGRGHKSSYALIPGPDPGSCDCRKRRTAGRPSIREKVNYRTPISGRKGELGHTEKANINAASPQVKPGFALRDQRGEEVVEGERSLCIGGCGRPARRACSTCFDHGYLEVSA